MRGICETCRFWDTSSFQRDNPDTTGLCRVNPPVADDRDGTARWPFTEDSDWCGAYRREIDWIGTRKSDSELPRDG